MTAPWPRDNAARHRRLPPRRGGRPSSRTCSAAGRRAGLARLAGARRGLVGSARALAAAALLALFGALALPATAQAQTTTTFVSNLGQTDAVFNAQVNPTVVRAQQFMTGSNSDGYRARRWSGPGRRGDFPR